jgi:hypothetical protein
LLNELSEHLCKVSNSIIAAAFLLNACQTGFRSSCHGFAHLANCREMGHAPGRRNSISEAVRLADRLLRFDLLELEGDDLKNRRLAERKARPQQVLSGSEVRYYAEPGSAETVARTVSDAELEGVIAKKARFHLPRPGAGALTGSTSS